MTLRSEAIAWYWPSGSGVVSVALHAPPVADLAVHSPCSAAHGVVILQIATVTGVPPAVPVNVGIGVLICALTGAMNTLGAVGSTTNWIGLLLPVGIADRARLAGGRDVFGFRRRRA